MVVASKSSLGESILEFVLGEFPDDNRFVSGRGENNIRVLCAGGNGGNPAAVTDENSAKGELISHDVKICLLKSAAVLCPTPRKIFKCIPQLLYYILSLCGFICTADRTAKSVIMCGCWPRLISPKKIATIHFEPRPFKIAKLLHFANTMQIMKSSIFVCEIETICVEKVSTSL